ncbi:hypothetical protein ACXOL9_004746 [Vibrio parahaemolyticus]
MMPNYDDFSPRQKEVFCFLTGTTELAAVSAFDNLSKDERLDAVYKVRQQVKVWDVIDDCVKYLHKRKLLDAMESSDFQEFAEITAELKEFEGDILQELRKESSISRIRKLQLKTRQEAMLAQSEAEKDIPSFRIEFIKAQMRSLDEVEQLNRIAAYNMKAIIEAGDAGRYDLVEALSSPEFHAAMESDKIEVLNEVTGVKK